MVGMSKPVQRNRFVFNTEPIRYLADKTVFVPKYNVPGSMSKCSELQDCTSISSGICTELDPDPFIFFFTEAFQ